MMPLRQTLRKWPLAPQLYALLRLWRGRNARFASDYSVNSGVGSDLRATQSVITALPEVLVSLSAHSMLDIPCGDFFWMRHIDLGSVSYVGADVIGELIESHQRQFGAPARHFQTLDLITDNLPTVDVIFCRDCLVHFSNRFVKRAVNNVKRSRSKYLLTTTFPQHANTNDIVTGSWRPLNLSAAPFHFPPPLRLINEGHLAPHADKSLGLWHVDDLPEFS